MSEVPKQAADAGPAERHVRPLMERLREAEADYTLTYGSGDLYGEAADQIEALKTVMVAAAEEIARHWAAHCDAEGYGPQNLLRRLEEGIPSEYGYTAGAFEELRVDAERYRWLRAQHWDTSPLGVVVEPRHAVKLGHDLPSGERLDEAVDAAMQAKRPNAKLSGPNGPQEKQR